MLYQHFLIPVDDSTVSAANVRHALQMAKELGSRVTFFHALLDWSSTSDGAIIRSVEPDAFADMAQGATNAVLAKSIISARVVGVTANACARISNKPAESIVAAAQELGCDLIVMASRGSQSGFHGWFQSSQTQKVLRLAPMALLVTRVDANMPESMSEQALSVIEDEHRGLAVVVEGVREILSGFGDRASADQIRELGHILTYLDGFSSGVHHPKEERYIHRALVQRHPEALALIAEVEAQHVAERALLANTLAAYEMLVAGTPGATALFQSAATLFVTHALQHIGLEERILLPLARHYLTESDWADIAEAFSENDGPNFSDLTVAEFRKMFSHIANSVAAEKFNRLN